MEGLSGEGSPLTPIQRIFVVGVPRSGTTLVQSLLAAHDAVTSFTESHLFSRHFRHLPGLATPLLVRDPCPRLEAWLDENDAGPAAAGLVEEVRRVLPLAPFRPLATRAVARALLEVMDRLAGDRGSSVWVEKTPAHLGYLSLLESLDGAASSPRFVHVIRAGLETVASLHVASRSWERHYSLEECVRRWNSNVELSLSRLGGPRDHFVVYEDLTERPAAVLERLFGELGLDWQLEVLERFGAAAGGLILSDEPWKKGTARPLRTSSTSREVLTQSQRQSVQAGLRSGLYETLREAVSP